MFFFRPWILGVKSLLLHPLRSALTVLGIFIGVASVIWLLAIGEGISEEAKRQIEGLGATNIIVRSVKPPTPSSPQQNRGPIEYGLKREDYRRIMDTATTLKNGIEIRELRRQFNYRDRTVYGRLVACTPDYPQITQLKMESGRFIEDADQKHKYCHCVLAASVAERLFRYENPIGQSIYLPENQTFFKVIGIVASRSPTAAIGGSLDSQDFGNDVYIPMETHRARIGDMVRTRRSGSDETEIVQLTQVTFQVDDVKNVMQTAEFIKETLKNHDKTQDVATVVPLELLEQARTTQMMFMVFMGLIAAISLLVGGIGIMNIMLATVTERTREIGIRRALGARRSDIIRQFLVETIVLSVGGGGTGVIGGLLCPVLINQVRNLVKLISADFYRMLPDVARTVQPVIVPLSIPAAFLIAVIVGVVFGLYPAIRAAMMDPIEALRHE